MTCRWIFAFAVPRPMEAAEEGKEKGRKCREFE